MAKLWFAAIAGTILLTGSGSAAGYGDGSRCQASALAAAQERGIERSEITDIQTVVLRSTDDGPTDTQAWLTVKRCPSGNVVVQMTPACFVEDVYTRGGCTIDGVPRY